MRKFPILIIAAVLTGLVCAPAGFAVVVFSTASGGNFGNKSAWNGKVPGPGDDAVIVAGASMEVSAGPPQNIHSLTFSNNNAGTTTFTIDSGATLNVAGGVTNQNAAATNTFVLIQGNGTLTCTSLTVGGTTTPTPAGSDFTATLTSTISNLTVSGTISVAALYNSAKAAANQGTFALASGSVTASGVNFITVPFFGPILTLAAGTQNGTLTLSGGTPFTSSGGGSSTFSPNGTNATVIYSGGIQAVMAAVYQNLVLAGGGAITVSNVTVNGTFFMQGNPNVSAAPTYGPNAVLEYNGNSPQNAGAELPATIANLTINNSHGVTLTKSTTVTNLLTLTNGNFVTGNNDLIIASNALVWGGTSSSYVNGNVQKKFNVGTQSFLFPVGDNTEFAPLSVSNLSVTVAGVVAAATAAGVPPQMPGSGINQQVNRYWMLTNSSGTFGNYNATFNYTAADLKGGAVPAQFAVNVLNGGTWSRAIVSGTSTTNSTSISGEGAFGTFVIGYSTAGSQTITFPSPGSQSYGVAPITLTATASSGLPVSYSVTSGPATVSNKVLTIAGAGSVTIQASQSGNADWNAATPVSQTISVAQKTVTGGFTANNKAYDGTTTATVASSSLSGVINSDIVNLTVGSVAFTNKNVGNGKTVVASGLGLSGANAGNYVLASISATNTANITAVTLTVTANNTNRVYGVANPVFTVSYSGFVNGENSSVLSGAPSVTSTATTSSTVAGSPYAITVTQGSLSAANYTFNFVNGSLSVTAATLTVTANNTNRIYGAANPVFSVSYSGFVNGDGVSVLSGAPSLATTATPSSSVPGSPYPITVTQGTLSAANYSFTFTNGSLTVTPATLTVTASNTNRVYGSANPVFAVNYSGFVNGEGTGVLSGAPTVTSTAGPTSPLPGSPYLITVSQGTLSATNYSFSFANGNLTVTPATLTVTANNTNRVYGLANPVFTFSYSGFVNGENSNVLSGAPSVTTSATTGSTVAGGPYAITVALGTLSATNYSFSFVNGSVSVTAATLTVTANDTNRVYGAANPTFSVSYSGFVNGDGVSVLSGAPSLATTATPSSPVPGSPYLITVSQGTLSATNYSFSFVNGNLTVTPATLTVTANNTNRVYGAANPVFAVNYSGFVNGEGTGVLSGVPTVTSTASATSPVPGSPYLIAVSQGTLSATNYSFSFANGNLTVTPATLTVTANNQARPYGTTNPVLTASYGGLVNGENTNVLSGSPSLSTTAVSNSPPGAYTIQIVGGTLSATNYGLSFVNGTLTVDSLPPMLTIQFSTGATNVVVIGAIGVTPNSTYQILGSTDLVNWSEIGSAQSASDGTMSFTNPAVSAVQFFKTSGP